MAKFFQILPNKGDTFKQQFDIISKICSKYLDKNVDLYKYYKTITYNDYGGYDKMNEILNQTLEKISEKYYHEVQIVNYTLKMFAEKFDIKLKSEDTREIIQAITKNEDYIRNHKNFGKEVCDE